jgi:hypothetical protein
MILRRSAVSRCVLAATACGNRGEFAQTDAYMSTVEKSEGIGIAVGIAVGVPIGMIFDSVGAGIGIGIAMAIAAGLVLKR